MLYISQVSRTSFIFSREAARMVGPGQSRAGTVSSLHQKCTGCWLSCRMQAGGERPAHRLKHRAVRSRPVPINQGVQYRLLVYGLCVTQKCVFYLWLAYYFLLPDPWKTWLKNLKTSLYFFFIVFFLMVLVRTFTFVLPNSPSFPDALELVVPFLSNSWVFQPLFWAQVKAGHEPGSWPWWQKQGLNVFYPSGLGLPDKVQDSVLNLHVR